MKIKICKIDSLSDSSCLGLELDDRSIFVVKSGGLISVFVNSCPHLGTPLEFLPNQFLTTDKSLIQCSTHGALFTISDGMCISGPCSGQSLKKLAHEIVEGELYA